MARIPPPKRKKKTDMFEPLVKWREARKMAKRLDPSGRLSDLDIEIQLRKLEGGASLGTDPLRTGPRKKKNRPY